jgi:hypothetical protein
MCAASTYYVENRLYIDAQNIMLNVNRRARRRGSFFGQLEYPFCAGGLVISSATAAECNELKC